VGEYQPQVIEKKWQAIWAERGTFRTPELPVGAKKFYCLDMFPYPSGEGLHVGHPLGYTATDIVSRYKRMNGYSVLHPMGFDAFGLPAEQHAIKTGQPPALITAKNCKVFASQLKTVGLSYDWDRQLATCTPDYYSWTQWIFLKIYNSWFDEAQNRARPIEELPIPAEVQKKGALAIDEYKAQWRLAYYSQAMVNWCPELGTVLANEEVIDGKSERGGFDVIRKPMKQWMMRITKYAERLLGDLDQLEWPTSISDQQRNWIGRKNGAEISFKVDGLSESLVAFTTRPDTLFGVTFFVISPEHPLVNKVTKPENVERVQSYREQALKMSELQRTVENRKKTGVFTGSYLINPITEEHIPLYVGDYVLMTVGTGAVMGVPAHDERDFEFARTFQIEIRPVVLPVGATPQVEQAAQDGEIAWTGPGIMAHSAVPAALELRLEGQPNDEAGRRIVQWLADRSKGRGVVNFKLRDWVFSRQRYWGEPFPIIHWEDGTTTCLDESELPLKLPEVPEYKPSEGGESPLARATDWVQVVDPKSGKKGRRETNTMPNWAGSCWYYLRFIDPKNSMALCAPEKERAWMSVDLYVGGAEHAVLHLLYARFWHKVLFDLGYVTTNEPFKKLFNQGMVQAFAFKDRRGALVPVDEVDAGADGKWIRRSDGDEVERLVAKMSKSLRNVESLDKVVGEFGADTFRMYLMFMGPLDAGRPWDPKAISGNFRFLKRIWRFATGDRDSGVRDLIDETNESTDVKRAINLVIKRVTADVEGMQFNTAISAMMEFLNSVGDAPISKPTLERLILILSPFAPHICEELWQRIGHAESLAYESWPTFDQGALAVATVSVVVQVMGKKRALVEVATECSEDQLKAAVSAALIGTDYKIGPNDKFITVYQAGTKTPRLVNIVK